MAKRKKKVTVMQVGKKAFAYLVKRGSPASALTFQASFLNAKLRRPEPCLLRLSHARKICLVDVLLGANVKKAGHEQNPI